MRFSYAFALLFVLSACGDPLAQVERISDVELVEETSAQALPSQEELDREGGFFSRILRRDTDQAEVEAAVSSAEQAVDSGADDASEGAETEVLIEAQPASEPTEIAGLGTEAEAAPQANLETQAEQQTPPKKGILGWLQSKAADEDTGSIVASEAVSEIDPAQNAEPATTFDAAVTTLNDADGATADLVEPKKRRGLFGLGRTNDAENPETVRTASLSPEPVGDAPVERAEPSKRRGLFAGSSGTASRGGVDSVDVPYGTVLPYGQVARVCDAQRKPMGRKLDKAPARGKGYALFDSNPDAGGQRTFYITGFADGCPRQFTASLAVFGAPSMHEQLRYGRPSSEYPYSTTDKAYEKVKSSVCGVAKRKPCGSKISQVERNTVFISTYERFEGNARWADILIHDGVVLAKSIKSP
ncbi:hypothetical protein [Ascidiaceihabitans sp.]|uniref:hypothetical protein n=1 Tax=Ascidiaceihabitans sp. TaxID=1872644 RepID=UPI003298310B